MVVKKLKDLSLEYKYLFPIEESGELNVKITTLRTYDEYFVNSNSDEFTFIKKLIESNCHNFKNCIWFYSDEAAPLSKLRIKKGLFYRDQSYEKYSMIQKEEEVAENRFRLYALVKIIPAYINAYQKKLLNWYNGFILLTNDDMEVIEKQSRLWNGKNMKSSLSVDYNYVAKYLINSPTSVALRYIPAQNYKDEKIVVVSQGSLNDFITKINLDRHF